MTDIRMTENGRPHAATRARPSPQLLSPRWVGVISAGSIAVIVLLAFLLRIYHLDRIPPGLFYDEAFNAIQARDVLLGTNRPVFFTGNYGEEPVQMYTAAGLFALAGQSPWALRMACAILGLLLVPALYFCGRSLFPGRRLVALAAALVGAYLFWAVSLSRIGWETNALPAVLTLSAGAVMVAYRTGRLRWAAAAGVLVGATFYTYLASRVWPVVLVVWVGYLLLAHRREVQARLGSGVMLAVAAVVVAAPLGLFFLQNPEAFLGRAGQVVDAGSVATGVVRTAGMYFVAGDTDPRDNLPGRAALDPVLGILFVVGLAVSVRRVREPGYGLLLIWLVVMSLPSAVTEFAPNFRRALGGMPAVVLVVGVGVEWVWVQRERVKVKGGGVIWGGLLGLALLSSAWSNIHAYFVEWAQRNELYYTFDVGLYDESRILAARPAEEQILFSSDYAEHYTVLWAMNGRPYSSFDGRRLAVLPDPGSPASYGIVVDQGQFNPQTYYPAVQPQLTLYDYQQRPYAQIYRIPAGEAPRLAPQHPLEARLGDFIRVLGYDLSRQGERIQVKIYWRAESQPQADYTVFVHLLGPGEGGAGTKVWSQDDAQPGHGTYPTTRWLAGQTIVDNYSLELPTNAPAGAFQAEFGMYQLASGARLPVWQNGQRLQNDSLLISESP